MLADTIGPALLDGAGDLSPAERLAFVLHDMFAVPFDQIAEILGRTPAATKQLASRGRRGCAVRTRGHGNRTRPGSARWSRRSWRPPATVTSRPCCALLHPDVVLRADPVTVATGARPR